MDGSDVNTNHFPPDNFTPISEDRGNISLQNAGRTFIRIS
jgi:hypothetical protein